MEHLRRSRAERIAAELAMALLFVLAGCSFDPSASTTLHGNRDPGTPGPTPGGLAPTATTANITPIATASVQCGVQALPSGWTWYQDARYSFRLAVPPGWRTGSFEYIPDGSNVLTSPSHIHVVDIFGPESDGQATSSGKMRSDGFPPVITIEVDVGSGTRPTPYGTGVMSNWSAQTTPVCIGKTPITPFLFTNDEGDVEWAAVLPAGPHGYLCEFSVASSADTATRDGMYFQTALTTFTASP